MRLHLLQRGIRRNELPDRELVHRLCGINQDRRRRKLLLHQRWHRRRQHWARARAQHATRDTKVRAAILPALAPAPLTRARTAATATSTASTGGLLEDRQGPAYLHLVPCGYAEGVSCQTVGACGASTDPSATGSDGNFYCINGGSVGGTAGLCTCTSCNAGYEGASCQTASTCTALADSTKDGSDGTFYCINGGTIGAQRWIMHMHMQSHRVPHT